MQAGRVTRRARLPVPRVERAVVAGLPNVVEEHVAFHGVAAVEAVVKIHASTRPVIAHVVPQIRARGERLEVAARLLAVDAVLVDVVG